MSNLRLIYFNLSWDRNDFNYSKCSRLFNYFKKYALTSSINWFKSDSAVNLFKMTDWSKTNPLMTRPRVHVHPEKQIENTLSEFRLPSLIERDPRH